MCHEFRSKLNPNLHEEQKNLVLSKNCATYFETFSELYPNLHKGPYMLWRPPQGKMLESIFEDVSSPVTNVISDECLKHYRRIANSPQADLFVILLLVMTSINSPFVILLLVITSIRSLCHSSLGYNIY